MATDQEARNYANTRNHQETLGNIGDFSWNDHYNWALSQPSHRLHEEIAHYQNLLNQQPAPAPAPTPTSLAQQHPTHAMNLTRIFEDFLLRPPTTAEMDHHIGILIRGEQTIQEIRAAIRNTSEAIAIQNNRDAVTQKVINSSIFGNDIVLTPDEQAVVEESPWLQDQIDDAQDPDIIELRRVLAGKQMKFAQDVFGVTLTAQDIIDAPLTDLMNNDEFYDWMVERQGLSDNQQLATNHLRHKYLIENTLGFVMDDSVVGKLAGNTAAETIQNVRDSAYYDIYINPSKGTEWSDQTDANGRHVFGWRDPATGMVAHARDRREGWDPIYGKESAYQYGIASMVNSDGVGITIFTPAAMPEGSVINHIETGEIVVVPPGTVIGDQVIVVGRNADGSLIVTDKPSATSMLPDFNDFLDNPGRAFADTMAGLNLATDGAFGIAVQAVMAIGTAASFGTAAGIVPTLTETFVSAGISQSVSHVLANTVVGAATGGLDELSEAALSGDEDLLDAILRGAGTGGIGGVGKGLVTLPVYDEFGNPIIDPETGEMVLEFADIKRGIDMTSTFLQGIAEGEEWEDAFRDAMFTGVAGDNLIAQIGKVAYDISQIEDDIPQFDETPMDDVLNLDIDTSDTDAPDTDDRGVTPAPDTDSVLPDTDRRQTIRLPRTPRGFNIFAVPYRDLTRIMGV